MPKENTHLFFSANLINRIEDQELRSLLNKNLIYYYLGTITPDVFYYHRNSKVKNISNILHGVDGRSTNEIIFELLDIAKRFESVRDLTFIMGYISHCSLDIIFHPAIYSLTGNYHSEKDKKRNEMVYMHRLLETFIDEILNKDYFLNQLIDIKKIDLIESFKRISEKYNMSTAELYKTFRRQLFFNKLFKSNKAFLIITLLEKIKITKKENIGFFYRELKNCDIYKCRNFLTNIYQSINVTELLERSFSLALEMISSAYGYHKNKLSFTECKQIISGKSLDTGHINCPINSFNFTPMI